MSYVWLITGCSTGLGRELAHHAAAQGDRVVGTLRQEAQIAAFEAPASDHLTGLLADVTRRDEVFAAVDRCIALHGRIDVLVNNAGYGSLGPVEVVSEAEMLRQFEVNVFGAVRMIQAVLPHMRARRSGHILNITSIAGLQGYPGVGIYNGSKFALEGIGEALAAELQPLGIRVTNVEPGPFRTDWAGRSASYAPVNIADYADSAQRNMESIASVSGRQVGDPAKAAAAMFALTRLDEPPVHQLLGGPAYRRARVKFREMLDEIDRYEHIGLPTDYD
ncbi:MAG: oxidoreductase [Bacteroidia bacterium]